MSGNYGNNNGGFKAPPREKTVQDTPALKLTAPRSQGQERAPSLMFYIHPNKNKPSNTDARMVVFTQTPDNDPKKQKIEAKLNLLEAISVIKAIQKMCAYKPGEVPADPIVAASLVPKDFRNPAAGKRENCKIYVGRNDKGVYLSMVSWNQEVPRLRFFFGADPDAAFQWVVNSEKGQTFGEFSALTADAWADIQATYMKQEHSAHWKPYAPPAANNGGNSYGGGNNYNNNNSSYNNNGGNSGGNSSYTQPASAGNDDDPFDDLPM